MIDLITHGYSLFYAPFEFNVNYFAMSHAEARQYLDSYVSEIPVRIELLRPVVGINADALEHSGETMSALDRFLDAHVATRLLTDEELQAKRDVTMPLLRDHVPT